MATVPIVKWMNSGHSAELPRPFDFQTIDAGDSTPVYTFNIWNNMNGATDVSKMEDCTITTRDMSGGTGEISATIPSEVEVVLNSWFHAQVDSLGENDLDDPSSEIGKVRSKPIGTTGSTTKDNSGTNYPVPITPAAKEILGVANNGNPVDAAGNYVTISLKAVVPLDAKSGRQEFKLRVNDKIAPYISDDVAQIL